MLKNTKNSWGSVAKFFHWTVAVLVIFMLLLGLSFSYVDKSIKIEWMVIHKSVGMIILVLMLARLCWRIINITPKLPLPCWQITAARIHHGLFYVVLFAMIISGLLVGATKGRGVNFFWLFQFDIPFPQSRFLHEFFEGVHTFLAWTIVVLWITHMLVAIKHHVVDKNDILLRMLPNRKHK